MWNLHFVQWFRGKAIFQVLGFFHFTSLSFKECRKNLRRSVQLNIWSFTMHFSTNICKFFTLPEKEVVIRVVFIDLQFHIKCFKPWILHSVAFKCITIIMVRSSFPPGLWAQLLEGCRWLCADAEIWGVELRLLVETVFLLFSLV